MNRDPSDRENRQADFPLRRAAIAVISVGMILPEYLLIFVGSAFIAATTFTIVQTINPRDGVPHAEAPSVIS